MINIIYKIYTNSLLGENHIIYGFAWAFCVVIREIN